MEQAKQYPSIERHFGGCHDGEHPAGGVHRSIQSMVWQSPNKQKFTIAGGHIDRRLEGKNIDVQVADVEYNGSRKKVAVTCFEDPSEGIDVQRPGNFPACRKPIVNRVFILRGDYDEADIIEAIQDEIVREEELKKSA